MNILSRDKQIQIVSALTEGLGMRATTRLMPLKGPVPIRLVLAYFRA